MGRLSPEKGGVDTLLHAVQLLHDGGTHVTLDIAGDGPDRRSLERTAEEIRVTPFVRFHGMVPRDQVPKLYQCADLVVLPSRGEMMPRVMLEAWAHGAPFLGTPVGAIPDYLVDNVNGFLVREVSPFALAQRLAEILSQPGRLADISRAGRESARTRSWRNAAETLLRDALRPVA